MSVPMITAGSIAAMTGLADRPVYFVTMQGQTTPSLVVKGESAGLDKTSDQDVLISVAWSSKLMRNVQNDMVNTKIMTPAEIQAFKAAAQAAFGSGTKQHGYVTTGTFNWVKMPFVPGLSDAQFSITVKEHQPDGTTQDKNKVDLKAIKKIIAKLSDDAVWRELGKVVAVDIFNGNNDRFHTETGQWTNRGNVMFLAGGSTPVIGLDTFDPNAAKTHNLNARGADQRLLTLIDPARRMEFAEKCAASVGVTMRDQLRLKHVGVSSLAIKAQGPDGPTVVKIPIKKFATLFTPYASSFEEGLAKGAEDLKAYLQRKVRSGAVAGPARAMPPAPAAPNRGFMSVHRNAPARPATLTPAAQVPIGVRDRMGYLGW
jgi:hypothetical protein